MRLSYRPQAMPIKRIDLAFGIQAEPRMSGDPYFFYADTVPPNRETSHMIAAAEHHVHFACSWRWYNAAVPRAAACSRPKLHRSGFELHCGSSYNAYSMHSEARRD